MVLLVDHLDINLKRNKIIKRSPLLPLPLWEMVGVRGINLENQSIADLQ